MPHIAKPPSGEFNPYMSAYIDLVPEDGQVLKHIETAALGVENLIRSFSDAERTTPHAPGEWTVQEILGHIIDSERVFAYRAMCVARGEQQNLPGFEEDDYAAASNANTRDIENMLTEYHAVRASTLAMFRGFTDEMFLNIGSASGKPYSVRAAAYIIAGHEQHHIKSIRENYRSLPTVPTDPVYRADFNETQ